jgi:hypothetical protein
LHCFKVHVENQSMKRNCIAVILLLAAATCYAETPPQGKVVVYRLAKHWNRAGNAFTFGTLDYKDKHDRWAVLCDGKKVTEKLRVNQYAEITLATGQHSCKVNGIGLSTRYNPPAEVEVRPDDTVYMRMRIQDGMNGRWVLEPVDEQEALEALQTIKSSAPAPALP